MQIATQYKSKWRIRWSWINPIGLGTTRPKSAVFSRDIIEAFSPDSLGLTRIWQVRPINRLLDQSVWPAPLKLFVQVPNARGVRGGFSRRYPLGEETTHAPVVMLDADQRQFWQHRGGGRGAWGRLGATGARRWWGSQTRVQSLAHSLTRTLTSSLNQSIHSLAGGRLGATGARRWWGSHTRVQSLAHSLTRTLTSSLNHSIHSLTRWRKTRGHWSQKVMGVSNTRPFTRSLTHAHTN